MKFRNLALAASLGLCATAPALVFTEIQWWHSMDGALETWVNDLAKDFNSKQADYKVVPVYKGQYPEALTAAIAAFRAGQPPHILQGQEVATATLMAAKGAVKPVQAPWRTGPGWRPGPGCGTSWEHSSG